MFLPENDENKATIRIRFLANENEVNRKEVLEDLRDLAIKKVPGDLGENIGILRKALIDLQAHNDCAVGDLQKLSRDFRAQHHFLECAIKDVDLVRLELACIRAAAKVIRAAILSLTDTAQIAVLIDPVLRALSDE